MLPVTVVYFCYGWTLWLYLNWLPSFFLHEYQLDIGQSALFASAVFFAGVGGDLLGGTISDAILRRTGNLLQGAPQRHRRRLSRIVRLPAADVSHSRPDDDRAEPGGGVLLRGDRDRADVGDPDGYRPEVFGDGERSDEHRFGAAAILSPLAFGYVAGLTGDWHLPFLGSLGLLLAGALLAPTMKPERPFDA